VTETAPTSCGEIKGGIQLDGVHVYDRAVRMRSDTVNRLRDNDIEPTIIVGHQANSRILHKVRATSFFAFSDET
jgi:3-oxoacyl-[acyl-carrier-protein] synthase III